VDNSAQDRLKLTAAASVILAWLGCGGDSDAAPPAPLEPARDASALIVLPDTQFYACAYPDIFEAQTRWIARVRTERHIAMVLHTGDIVDSDIDLQWQVAHQSLSLLSGIVPYLVTTGNHDLTPPQRTSHIGQYIQTASLDAFDLETAAYEPSRVDNSYAVVPIGGREWLVVGLEFGPRDRVVEWASDVLEAHAELPAIVFTHAYLYSDGQRYDRLRMPPQPYHPDGYGQTPDEGINDGEDLWQKLIAPHENVRLVLSGHVIPIGTAHASVQRPSGSVVHQVLANYQLCDACPCAQVEGGGGYLRLLEFSSDAIHVQTYSPHYQRWLMDPENDFVLTPAL
jgi:3',5'-cyclic AMP phosphodiesterase CpdA